MKLWVVTGGIGTGKSGFCRHLQRLAVADLTSFSCDESSHRLWETEGMSKRLLTEFGTIIADERTGEASRDRLRELVFSNETLRKRLEAIFHPLIYQELEASMRNARKAGIAKVFLAEVPLYHESAKSLPADMVIVVAATRTVQQARLMEHRNLDASTCERMLNAQLPIEKKTETADVVVWNDGSPAMLEAQALGLLRDQWQLLT